VSGLIAERQENQKNGTVKTKANAVMPAQAGIHKFLILITDKVTAFRPLPE